MLWGHVNCIDISSDARAPDRLIRHEFESEIFFVYDLSGGLSRNRAHSIGTSLGQVCMSILHTSRFVWSLTNPEGEKLLFQQLELRYYDILSGRPRDRVQAARNPILLALGYIEDIDDCLLSTC